MTGTPLSSRISAAPLPHPSGGGDQRVADWLDTLDPDDRKVLEAVPARNLLIGIADHSPYLWRLVTADATRCVDLLIEAPELCLAAALSDIRAIGRNARLGTADVMRELRRAKQKLALLVALADLGGVWSLEEVTAALTDFADAAVSSAYEHLLREAVRTGKLASAEPEQVEGADSGLAVLALGKQGGRELNYSSDIDLVVFFDPKARRLLDQGAASPLYVRLTQTFVKLMQERTADGYVLRVDLRLRPDPASTAVAIGLASAFSYYESYGQNWERAAFIKARPVAGDLDLGARFLADLAPFIWRKYFDYAAIADIHAMKRQIHAVRGQAAVAVAGHNVKLGRGGIREIEFFVQTQQLIFGGRRPALRGAQTISMLESLHADGWIGADAVEQLAAAYRFLRTIEHRLQMIADEQTQKLPAEDEQLEAFARFAGFASRAAFGDVLLGHMHAVERHYARLFEHAPGLDAAAGSLVFTGTTTDPETLETLRGLGFTRPGDAAEIIRGWHFGRRPAVQSPRAREVLTELVPGLLDAMSNSADPDAALATMDTMFGRMPAAVELLSLLRSNERLRELFADILGSAPRLAGSIAARPHLLDAAIDPAALQDVGDRTALQRRLRQQLEGALATEDFLDRTRDAMQEERFLIGVRLLSGLDEAQRTGEALSDLADAIVSATLDRCLSDFAREHGRIPGGACVVLGMGKLGSREMTVTSDLDLIVVYRFDPDAGDSDGPRPLDGTRYYTRLTQRVIAALTAPTRRGRLYDVDVRLRPSGRQGPLATQLRAFVHYQEAEAQAWEHMALTRARVVAGDSELARDVEQAITQTLTTPRDTDILKGNLRAMRALVAREKGEGQFWDMKLAPGGLLDLEFIAQFLALRFGPTHPEVLRRAPSAIIEEAGALGLLAEETTSLLRDAHRLQTTLLQLTRLTVEDAFDPTKTGAGVLRRLAAAANQPDISALQSELGDVRSGVRAALREILDWQEPEVSVQAATGVGAGGTT